MTIQLYNRVQLPQWTIEDILTHNYTYYFGFASLKNLKPSQRPEDYEQERIRKKLSGFKLGYFDPIITDCDFQIICGHHRHKMLKDFYSTVRQVPIICLEGVTIQQVVEYYESTQLHRQAQLDWMAENRAIEDHDYHKLIDSMER